MRVLLTGATGFTGSHVVGLLRQRGLRVRCFVRPTSDTRRLRELTGLEIVEGDVGNERSLSVAMQDVDTLLSLTNLGSGYGPLIVSTAERAGVRRAVFVGTTAMFTSIKAKSKVIRLAAENAVRASKLQHTIIRPTMIYGASRDDNMVRLIRFLRRSPVIPVIGSGRHLQQPVYVEDVAHAIVAAMESDSTIGRAYNIAGAAPLTFDEVIDTIARLLGRRVMKIHLPLAPMLATIGAAERMGLKLPLSQEQFRRLNEDKAFDYSEAERDFGYAPLSFEEGIRRELAEMKLA